MDDKVKEAIETLRHCRDMETLEKVESTLMIIASNAFYDDKISNSTYNEITSCCKIIRDICGFNKR